MPLIGSAALIRRPYFPSSSFNNTGSSFYETPLGVRITIKSLDKLTTYYEYDSFNPSNKRIIYCSLQTSLSSNGQFKIQFLDDDQAIDKTKIRTPARVYIDTGKSSSRMYRRFSGMIRNEGMVKGYLNNILWEIEGFGTGIRRNERILDISKTADKVEDDGVTIDVTDRDFFVDELVEDTLEVSSSYPSDVQDGFEEGTGELGYLDSSTTKSDSIINDFIPSVNNRFEEMADVHRIFEEYTGARIFVDQFDKVHIQPVMSPSTATYGYIIKDVPDKVNDNADYTIYSRDRYSRKRHYEKDMGFSSKLYGILPADPVPDPESGDDADAFYENKTVEVAQRFRPPTNPNWRLFCGIEGVGFTNVESENSVRTRWRLCEDDGGIPKNVGGVIANKYMYPNQYHSTADGGVQVIQVMGLGNVDIDENKYYWLIFSSVNATASVYWRWHYYSNIRGDTATASAGTSSDVDGGSGWSTKKGPRMVFNAIRFKSEPYEITDHKSVSNTILIDSMTQGFPSQINTKLAAVKYMVGLHSKSARPTIVYTLGDLTVPNIVPQAGDICILRDSITNLSTTGTRVQSGQITDVNLEWGIEGGGSDPRSKGMTSMSLSIRGYPTEY